MELTRELVMSNIDGMKLHQVITYLKRYKTRELIQLTRSMGIPCRDSESKTEVLQKCLVALRGSGSLTLEPYKVLISKS